MSCGTELNRNKTKKAKRNLYIVIHIVFGFIFISSVYVLIAFSLGKSSLAYTFTIVGVLCVLTDLILFEIGIEVIIAFLLSKSKNNDRVAKTTIWLNKWRNNRVMWP